MNWISALSWPQWLLLGLVPPLIVLLYFLKLRRTALEVPSTYLWTRAIEDLHVNSLWQRLRNNLLLWLQLLLVALLILACLRPGCEGETLEQGRYIFMIDQSASMAARDAGDDGNRTRLEEAKRQVANMIDRMSPGDAAMLICFSDRANVVQSYTRNPTLLKQKLAEIDQTQRPTEMTEALVAAAGLANPGRTSQRGDPLDVQVAEALDARLLIYSDGGVDAMPNVSLGENLATEYRPVGAPAASFNLGVVAFSISDPRQAEGRLEAFAKIQNSDDVDHAVDVTLFLDGELFDAQAGVLVAAGSATSLNFDLSPLLGELREPRELRIALNANDRLPLDDEAFAVLNPPRRSQVLVVTERNPYLRYALQTDRAQELAEVEFQPPGWLEDEAYVRDAELGKWDLIIYDGCAPDQPPLCSTVYIGALPPTEWSWDEPRSPTPVVDANQAHPLLAATSVTGMTVIESRPLTGPSGTISLIDSTDGSIMAIGPRGGFLDLVLGFGMVSIDEEGNSLVNTDWPSSLSFPLFIQNLLVNLGGGGMFDATLTRQPGDMVILKPRLPWPAVEIRDPARRTTRLTARDDGTFAYPRANQVGIYEVIEPETGTVDQLFPINLLDPRESDLTVVPSLEIGFSEVGGERATLQPARKELWPWLVGLALVVLALEWLIYNRRIFI